MTPDERMNAVWPKLTVLQRAMVAGYAEKQLGVKALEKDIAFECAPDNSTVWTEVPERV